MAAVTIVRPDVSDEAQWRGLYAGYAEFYRAPMSAQIQRQVWAWIHDESVPLYALVAKDGGGDVVGLMHYRREYSPLRAAVVGFLDDLFVAPAWRGRGVVDELFGALAADAKRRSWRFVRWRTAEDNYRARAVYDKIAQKTAWQTYQLDIT